MKKKMGKGSIILIAVLVIAVLIGGLLIKNYNSLVTENQKVESAWAQVQNVVKRRADLIPNLVNTVKGYAKHEQETLSKVIEARSGVQNAKNPEELAKADGQLTNAIKSLNVVVERYPDLKANQGFLNLQDQLEGTENRIATERQRYNEAVKNFNIMTRRFPSVIFAKLFGYNQKQYFQINQQDQELPKVDF